MLCTRTTAAWAVGTREFRSEPGSIPVGANCGVRNGIGVPPAEACVLFLSANHASSSCWYSGWYRQQYKKKFAFNSNGYGIKRLSARGTKLKTLIITTTYAMGWIPDFQKYFLGTLKIHVKIHSSRPFCWHFCWYRKSKRSRRISAIPNDGIEQITRKNDGACAKPKHFR